MLSRKVERLCESSSRQPAEAGPHWESLDGSSPVPPPKAPNVRLLNSPSEGRLIRVRKDRMWGIRIQVRLTSVDVCEGVHLDFERT